LELFETFDPQRIERVFGQEVNLKLPVPGVGHAPIQRVALITESFLPKVDGVSKTAYLTLKYLKETGREVLVFAPDISPLMVDGVRVIPLRSLGVPGVPETRMALPNLHIARELHQFKPDLIHLFSPALMSVSGMANGRFMNVPVVANYQTDLPGYAKVYLKILLGRIASYVIRNWLRYIHNGCHLTLVPSQTIHDELVYQGYKRLRQWGRGVNCERFSPDHASDAWRDRLLNGRNPDSLVCLYVGRLATEKRIDLLLEVARRPGVALTIVGDGGEREGLEQLFEGTDTHFTGYLFGQDLSSAFASADVFVFTGPNETFGQVIQEAMASALPTIVINQGGAPDLVLEGETGFIVEPDAQAFAAAVDTLRDNPALLRQMRWQARQVVETRTWENVLSQLEGFYNQAVIMNNRFKQVFKRTNYHLRLDRVLTPPRSVVMRQNLSS
jgi:phosphatidylinositol alpha 1,6-mannosyltransferase